MRVVSSGNDPAAAPCDGPAGRAGGRSIGASGRRSTGGYSAGRRSTGCPEGRRSQMLAWSTGRSQRSSSRSRGSSSRASAGGSPLSDPGSRRAVASLATGVGGSVCTAVASPPAVTVSFSAAATDSPAAESPSPEAAVAPAGESRRSTATLPPITVTSSPAAGSSRRTESSAESGVVIGVVGAASAPSRPRSAVRSEACRRTGAVGCDG